MTLLIVIVTGVLFIFILGAIISAPGFSGEKSDHFDGKKFMNPHGPKPLGFTDVLKWMISRDGGKWPTEEEPTETKHPLASENETIRVTYVNHSTFLIQVDSLNILTDPVWAKRASPFSWAGPKRMKAPGIKFEDLPRIHGVVISHNHYDHLDINTMRLIFGGHHPKFFVPLGVKAYLDGESITNVTELDWWNETKLSDSITIQAVPAQHSSGRGLLDKDETLWCGWVLKTSKGNIYFAGDTGYNDKTFVEIGERSGPMALSLIPIGAYLPRWFMAPVHTDPDEAVKVHLETKSAKSVAMHFGTFPLADEGPGASKRDFEAALKKYQVSEDKFVILKEGETMIID